MIFRNYLFFIIPSYIESLLSYLSLFFMVPNMEPGISEGFGNTEEAPLNQSLDSEEAFWNICHISLNSNI